MNPQEFKDVLLSVMEEVYHFEAPEETGSEYIVWQEMEGYSLYASDARCVSVQKFQVELYTREEFTGMLEKIMKTLEEKGIAFQEQKPYFDPDTKKIKYIIECEAV